MSNFVPLFVVTNKHGQFLAKNPNAGRNQLVCRWTRDRTEAETFDNWSAAADWGMTLPHAVQATARIEDQNGEPWSADRANKAKVYAPKPKGKPLVETPAAIAA